MEFFAKIFKDYYYFSKALHLRSLTEFWICSSLNKYSSTCRVTFHYVCMMHIQNPIIVNSDTFRHIHILLWHIQPYCGVFRTLCNSYIFRTLSFRILAYLRAQDIFRTLSRHILAYSECCATFAYWEPFHIQNFTIFRILAYLGPEAYSESCLYRHIQAYSTTVVIIT